MSRASSAHTEEAIAGFLRDTFRSVWTLELLLYLKRQCGRAVTKTQMVRDLRASEAIVSNGVEALFAAGLVLAEPDDSVRYQAASTRLATLADSAERLYERRPDAVRRLIVSSSDGAISAFADAFKLRGD